MADFTTPEAKKLNNILNNLRAEIDQIKGGTSKPQLTNSSIDVGEGRGFIPIIENGEIKMRIGRQPDGSIAIAADEEASSLPPVMPYAPLCVPVLGGVQVRCQGFVSKQFANFSYVKVYRDQAYYGNIIKVPGSIVVAPLSPGDHQFKLSSVSLAGKESELTEAVISAPKQALAEDIGDGIITTLKIANEAITNAKVAVDAITAINLQDGSVGQDQLQANAVVADKIAANAIQSINIAAGAIQAGNIAAEAISSDKIAANAITSDKIAANAITALQLAANAVKATNIEAGSVDASKLAAQLILASNQIIVGSLTGARLVMDTQGLTQFDSKGNLALQFGAQANKSNYLTIIDSTDPSNALASIAADGSMSMTGITINGKAKLNGVDLVQYLNSLPKGIMCQGTMPADSPTIQSPSYGLYELQADVVAGRTYKFCTSPPFVNGPGANVLAAFTLKGTFNGTAPTINSPAVGGTVHYVRAGTTNSAFQTYFVPTNTGRGRFLFQVGSAYNLSANSYDQIYVGGGLQFWIEDLGFVYQNTGGINSGNGVSNANGTYSRQWKSTVASYAYDTNSSGANALVPATQGLYMGQLNGTNYYVRLDFNYNDIAAVLAGATIHKVELFLYSYYWTNSTGGYVSIGRHSRTNSTDLIYGYDDRNIESAKMAKPDGQWIPMTNPGWGVGFRDGWIKGLVLDMRGSANNTATNYGQFRRAADLDGESFTPQLRFTYSK